MKKWFITDPFPPFITVIIQIIKSIILFINHNHHDSLNLNIINITPQRFIQFEVASIKANFWLGIRVSKYPSNKLPTIQDSVIIIEFFKVNSRTLTFLSSFKFLFQVIKPLTWSGEKNKYVKEKDTK